MGAPPLCDALPPHAIPGPAKRHSHKGIKSSLSSGMQASGRLLRKWRA